MPVPSVRGEQRNLQSYFFADLSTGWNPLANPRLIGRNDGGPVWHDLNNLRMDDGGLTCRGGVRTTARTELPTVEFNGRSNPSWDYNGQFPIRILFPATSDPVSIHRCVLVTSREVHYKNGPADAWTNLTPVYEVGTVDTDSGGTTVTIASGSPVWLTRGILENQIIKIGTESWSRIDTVSDTQLTLKDAVTGNLTGESYTIRRLFGGTHEPNGTHIATAIFNNELYVAGPNCGGGDQFAAMKTTLDGSGDELVYVCTDTPSATLVSGLEDVQGGAGVETVMGIDVLDDGRVIILARGDTGGVDDYTVRVYYSSPLDQTVWATSPGGFTDVTAVAGAATALVPWGNNWTIHTDRGIAFATPTGLLDPPLSYSATRAVSGAVNPRCVASIEGLGQVFVSGDGLLTLFDGSTSRVIDFPGRDYLTARDYRAMGELSHMAVDHFRQKVYVFFHDNGGDGSLPDASAVGNADRQTGWLTWGWNTGRAERGRTHGLLCAAAEASRGFDPGGNVSTYTETRPGKVLVVCMPSYDPEEAVDTSGTSSDMIYFLDEGGTVAGEDEQPLPEGATDDGGFIAINKALDFELPGHRKAVPQVNAWLEGVGSGSDVFKVALSTDFGSTWEEETTSQNLSAGAVAMVPFYFSQDSAEVWWLRVTFQVPNGLILRHLEVLYQDLGREEPS